ncbi:MAG: radical SAM protein [Armatimonadetes bacterium]|nr:radical SAM protein [Armatimonadota bacterium]
MQQNGQIMMTYRCSAACRHCLVMAAPQQDASRVSIERAVEYGLDFARLGRAVIIAGGEALLFYDHVLKMVRALRDVGVPVAFVESNGSWCASDERVRERLSRLQEAGMEGMYFSVDCWHQEFIPAQRVWRGIRIAREMFGPDRVYPMGIGLEEARQAEQAAGDDEKRRWAAGNGIHFIGRAAPDLAPLVEPVPLADLCAQDCRADLDIDALPEIQVDPFGFVRPDWCPGVNLGNTHRERLADLARTRRVQETPLLRGLAERGPASLLPLAKSLGITPEPAYASKCHLCFDLRRQMVKAMPQEFGPPHVYRVAPGRSGRPLLNKSD